MLSLSCSWPEFRPFLSGRSRKEHCWHRRSRNRHFWMHVSTSFSTKSSYLLTTPAAACAHLGEIHLPTHRCQEGRGTPGHGHRCDSSTLHDCKTSFVRCPFVMRWILQLMPLFFVPLEPGVKAALHTQADDSSEDNKTVSAFAKKNAYTISQTRCRLRVLVRISRYPHTASCETGGTATHNNPSPEQRRLLCQEYIHIP